MVRDFSTFGIGSINRIQVRTPTIDLSFSKWGVEPAVMGCSGVVGTAPLMVWP